MKYPEPQQMLGLRAMGKKGLDAYDRDRRNYTFQKGKKPSRRSLQKTYGICNTAALPSYL